MPAHLICERNFKLVRVWYSIFESWHHVSSPHKDQFNCHYAYMFAFMTLHVRLFQLAALSLRFSACLFKQTQTLNKLPGFFFNHLILFPWDNKLLQKFKRSWNYTTEKLTSAQGKNFHWVIKRNHSRIFVWTHELDYCNEKPSKEFCRNDFLPHRLWNNLHRTKTYTMETSFYVLHALFLVKV